MAKTTPTKKKRNTDGTKKRGRPSLTGSLDPSRPLFTRVDEKTHRRIEAYLGSLAPTEEGRRPASLSDAIRVLLIKGLDSVEGSSQS